MANIDTLKRALNSQFLVELRMIRGAFNCTPQNIAPAKDKGIYFAKAMDNLKIIINKYEKRER